MMNSSCWLVKLNLLFDARRCLGGGWLYLTVSSDMHDHKPNTPRGKMQRDRGGGLMSRYQTHGGLTQTTQTTPHTPSSAGYWRMTSCCWVASAEPSTGGAGRRAQPKGHWLVNVLSITFVSWFSDGCSPGLSSIERRSHKTPVCIKI